MKAHISILLLFLSLTSFKPVQKKADDAIVTGDGYVLKKFVVRKDDIKTTIYAAIIDPQKVRVKIVGLTQQFSNGRRAVEVGRSGAKVVLGGGFMSSFYPIIPNGFLKIDGTVITGIKSQGYNGLAGVKKSKLSLAPANAKSADYLDEGFQTGPFLIREGKIVFTPTTPASRNAYNRAFVGVTAEGKLLAAITTEPITLAQLSKYLINASFSELTCASVLNLAGGGSEALVVKGTDKTLFTYGSFSDNQSAMIAFY